MSVILYGTGPGCGRCTVVKAHLKRRGVPFIEVDLNLDIEQAKSLRAQGYNYAPVVRSEVDGEVSWSEGYHPDFIDTLAEVHAQAS